MRQQSKIKFDSTVKPKVWNFRDLTGARYGRLTVLRFVGLRKQRSYWLCRCDCGREKIVTAISLNCGGTKACGCLQSEITVARNKASIKHGHCPKLKPSPEYGSWNAMLMRCENPNNNKYASYGAAGVIVCERWHTFSNFLQDMGPRPEGTSLDRYPNPAGNYEPGNCRWATPIQQRHNRRDNTERPNHV